MVGTNVLVGVAVWVDEDVAVAVVAAVVTATEAVVNGIRRQV